MKTKIEPKLYSIDDACLVLGGISRGTLYKLIGQKKFAPIKMFRRTYIKGDEINAFIEAANS